MDSFTSLKENVGVLDVPNKVNTVGFSHFIMRIRKFINNTFIHLIKGTLKIIDIPGHERVRQRFFDSYKSSARGIIFVLDSFTVTKDIRDVAE